MVVIDYRVVEYYPKRQTGMFLLAFFKIGLRIEEGGDYFWTV